MGGNGNRFQRLWIVQCTPAATCTSLCVHLDILCVILCNLGVSVRQFSHLGTGLSQVKHLTGTAWYQGASCWTIRSRVSLPNRLSGHCICVCRTVSIQRPDGRNEAQSSPGAVRPPGSHLGGGEDKHVTCVGTTYALL